MLLAELEVFHSRPIAPTRRVAIGVAVLPTAPPPGFGGLPAVAPEMIASGTTEGEGVGMTRTLRFHDGMVAEEELIAFHPETFRYAYAMTENGSWPWEHYFCTVQLQALGGDQTHLAATGFFQPRAGKEDAIPGMLKDVYGALIQGYAGALGVAVVRQD